MDINHSIKLLESPKVVTIDFRFINSNNLTMKEQRRTMSPDRRSFTALRNQRHSNSSLQTRLSSCDNTQEANNFLLHRRSPVFKLLKFDSNGRVTNDPQSISNSHSNTLEVTQFLDFRNQTTFHRPVSLSPDFSVTKRKRASADSQTVIRLNHDNIQRWLVDHGIKSKLRSFSTANFQLDFNLLKGEKHNHKGRSQSHYERLDEFRRSLTINCSPRLAPSKFQQLHCGKAVTTSTGYNTIERTRGLKTERVSYFENDRPNSDFVSTGARFNCARKTSETQQRCLTPDGNVCDSDARHLVKGKIDVNSVVSTNVGGVNTYPSEHCDKMSPDKTMLTVSGDKIKLSMIITSSSVFNEEVYVIDI